MPNTAQHIEDKSLTLIYEARQFPATAPTVFTWFYLALAWAQQHRLSGLAETLRNRLATIPVPTQEAA